MKHSVCSAFQGFVIPDGRVSADFNETFANVEKNGEQTMMRNSSELEDEVFQSEEDGVNADEASKEEDEEMHDCKNDEEEKMNHFKSPSNSFHTVKSLDRVSQNNNQSHQPTFNSF